MKFYLSSYRLGSEKEKLGQLLRNTSKKFAYIPNARDHSASDPVERQQHEQEDMEELRNLGVEVTLLNLQEYFGRENELLEKLLSLGGVYVAGGNTFVLRQAMQLSGFDTAILSMRQRDNFIYAGYSAGVCVLCPTLKYYAITDDATDMPYPQLKEQIWEGLGIVDFIFEPHYHSDHVESASTDKEIQALIDDKVLFKAYKDNEVLIIE